MSAHSLSKLLGLLLVVGLGFLPLPAFAEGKTLLFCNRKGTIVNLAVGWMDYGFPVASGWYEFNINDCKRIPVPKADSYLPVFAYVEDLDGNGWIPTSYGISNNFCINRANRFVEKSTTACTVIDSMNKEVGSDWQKFGAVGNPLADFYKWELR